VLVKGVCRTGERKRKRFFAGANARSADASARKELTASENLFQKYKVYTCACCCEIGVSMG